MLRIGFVGLGNMGLGTALNLVRAGHEVIAYDLSKAARDTARAGRCKIAETLADTGKDVDAVVTMLPAGRHVREVYEKTLLKIVAPGTLLGRLLDHRRGDRADRRPSAVASEDCNSSMRRYRGGSPPRMAPR